MTIKEWCVNELLPYMPGSKKCSSYILKHYCEKAIGTYVSNEQFIQALDELGVTGATYGINKIYCIKNKFLRR